MKNEITIHTNGLVHIRIEAESSYIAAVISDNIDLSGLLEVSGFQWDSKTNIAVISGWRTKSFDSEKMYDLLER